MLDPVTTHGATKITMDSKERDYLAELAYRQGSVDGNPRSMDLKQPNYRKEEPAPQISTSANTPVKNIDTTGDFDLGTSMTERPSSNPDEYQPAVQAKFDDSADRRMKMYIEAAKNGEGNADFGNNDRSRTGSLRG